jgi:hypothetical protein
MDNTTNKLTIPGGAFLTARKTFESELWRNKPATWLKIWLYIYGNVQHGQYRGLKRGEGYFNFTELCKMKAFGLDVTINHVEKFLKYARSCGMIQTRKSTHGVVVLVCNYNLYQKIANYGGDESGERSGTELATTSRLEENPKAEREAETRAEEKRNGSGDINKNDKNDKASVAFALAKEKAWNTYSSRYLKTLRISDPIFIAEARQAFIEKSRSATENAVYAFINKQKEITPPDRADYKSDLWPEGANA